MSQWRCAPRLAQAELARRSHTWPRPIPKLESGDASVYLATVLSVVHTLGLLPAAVESFGPMRNRINPALVEQIRSDAYVAPLTLPQFSYVIATLRELSVMWAFGGSQKWPRERIDEAIAAVKNQVADFLGGSEGE